MPKIKINGAELAGSLGDIGIFLPFALSLVHFNGLNPVTVFCLGGLLYILSGLYFGHPMPVQPLKAMAVTALATGAGVSQISAASLIMGVFLLLFCFTRLSELMSKIFSCPIIRGIQFGLGLILVKKGVAYVRSPEFIFHGREMVLPLGNYLLPFGLLVGIISVLIALKYSKSPKVPASLIILGGGLFLGIIAASLGYASNHEIATAVLPSLYFPELADFFPALFLLVLPQIPLTVGNALYASSDTAQNYFEKAHRTTPKALSFSLGVANIIVGSFGGMPFCHGAGGLTAHYHFGARTGGSNFIIGSIFLVIGLSSLYVPVSLLYLIPISTLGSLLIYTGLEHAMFIQDVVDNKHDFLVALTVGSIAIISNLFIGCLAGLLVKSWMETVPTTTLQEY